MKTNRFATLLLLGTIPVLALAVALGVAANAPTATAAAGTTVIASVASDGTQAMGESGYPSVSGDGRYVAFQSDAGNLVPDDTNEQVDVFVRDLRSGETSRVSVASDGAEANWKSYLPDISAGGRHVSFASGANNLVPGDTNGTWDIFVHDSVSGETARVSVASDGTQGNWESNYSSISADGSQIAFASRANNLVPGDTNGAWDVFVHDRVAGETSRVSVESTGSQGNGDSGDPSISADGRYVAFSSDAGNLVLDDTNGEGDVFVHDRTTGETTRVSIAGDGAERSGPSGSPSISGDGRYVAYVFPYRQGSDVFAYDRETGETIQVSYNYDPLFPDYADQPSISADGRYIAFRQRPTREDYYIRVYDRVSGDRSRISVATNGSEANDDSRYPRISADGGYVAFISSASNLVPEDINICPNGTSVTENCPDVFVRDRNHSSALSPDAARLATPGETVTQTITLANKGALSDTYDLALSGNMWQSVIDGPANVSLASGADTVLTVVVAVPASATIGDRDIVTLSATSQGSPLLRTAADLITVVSGDFNLYVPFVVEPPAPRPMAVISRVSVASDGSEGNRGSYGGSVSADGRYVAFHSFASNLVPGDTNGCVGDYGEDICADVFVHDRVTRETARVSVASDGTQGDESSFAASITADGRYVAFTSRAGNLVQGDTNTCLEYDDETINCADVFVHDRATGETSWVSIAGDGTAGNGRSSGARITADGRYVAFDSFANNLVPGDTNTCPVPWPSRRELRDCPDVFVHDRVAGATTRVSVSSGGTQGNGRSGGASISGGGRYVAFESEASNLVQGDTNTCDDFNGEPISCSDIFVHDRATGETTRVSIASDGSEADSYSYGASISADGRYVAFTSRAGNLVPDDTNDRTDVFVHDRATGQTTRVSVTSDGTQVNAFSSGGSISGNGRYVAFDSYVWPGAGDPPDCGRYPCTDAFVHDSVTGETVRISVAGDGAAGNWYSWSSDISGDGRYVVFYSGSSLLPEGVDYDYDIFFRDRSHEAALSDDAEARAAPGTAATYTVVLRNQGVLADTYRLSLRGGAWPVAIDGATTVLLAPGASSEITVVVTVPAARERDLDTVTLTATSQSNPIVGDSATLTTTAGYPVSLSADNVSN
jgi:Tol biopolymer transport system component